MDKRTIHTYNLLAKKYDQDTADFWTKFPVGFIEKFAKEVNGGFVLDVGSGPGRDALILKKHNLDVICLDASKEMVNLTIQKELPTIKADFLKIPFNNKSFSGVWAYTSLLHIPKKDLKKALKEINRVLIYNGVLGLGMIEGEKQLYRKSSDISQPRLFAYYKKQELEKTLQSLGFEILHYLEFQPGTKKYLNFLARKIKLYS